MPARRRAINESIQAAVEARLSTNAAGKHTHGSYIVEWSGFMPTQAVEMLVCRFNAWSYTEGNPYLVWVVRGRGRGSYQALDYFDIRPLPGIKGFDKREVEENTEAVREEILLALDDFKALIDRADAGEVIPAAPSVKTVAVDASTGEPVEPGISGRVYGWAGCER